MLKIYSEPPKLSSTYTGPVIFAIGFRPFFALAGMAAFLLMSLWLLSVSRMVDVSGYYGSSVIWHSHEMLFGYVMAIIAGFLLTAVRNWTGCNTLSGVPLFGLALLWLVARFLPMFNTVLPAGVIAFIDLAFIPALALAIQPALWQGSQKSNRIFVPLLLLMGFGNLLVHLQALQIQQTATAGIDMMLGLVLLLITILAGRVMPFFTQSVIPDFTPKRYGALEIAALTVQGLWILTQALYPLSALSGFLAFAIVITQAARMIGWYHRNIWSIPILWVLYTGFLWLIAGFFLFALASIDVVPSTLAKHAFTVGAIGILTLGMMARVALGHTGRLMQPAKSIELTFILLNVAAVLRVFGPWLLPEKYYFWIHLSGGFWVFCFFVFTIVYLPILIQPRIDGNSG